jgi:hypothetical protein
VIFLSIRRVNHCFLLLPDYIKLKFYLVVVAVGGPSVVLKYSIIRKVVLLFIGFIY